MVTDGRGLFITLEGGEGTGKSTLSRGLAKALEAQGIPVLLTREPGGSPGAEMIRELLVTGDRDRWDGITEYLLLTACRRDHILRTILPALESGAWVICDRFFDSSLAYQGYGHGLDLVLMYEVYAWIAKGLAPDLTYVLDLDPEVGIARSLKRPNHEARYESLPLTFHHRVRKGFLALAQMDPLRYHVLDAGVSPKEALKRAWDVLHQSDYLPEHS